MSLSTNSSNLTLEVNQNKSLEKKTGLSDYRATKQSYCTWQHRRSEHKEIKRIITREADIMVEVPRG